MSNIAVIIPAYQEEENILKLIKSILKQYKNIIVFVIDDSYDYKTSKIVRKVKKRFVYFHRKKKLGRGSAVLQGLKMASKNKKIQYFIEMDADFSHNPKEIKKNIELFKKKKLDLLISSRYLKKSKIYNWSLFRIIFSKSANFLAKKLLKIPVSDYTNGFRIYSKRSINLIINKCGKIGDGFIILSEILLYIHLKNYKIQDTSTIFINRVRGGSSVNTSLILNSLIGLLKLAKIKKKILK